MTNVRCGLLLVVSGHKFIVHIVWSLTSVLQYMKRPNMTTGGHQIELL